MEREGEGKVGGKGEVEGAGVQDPVNVGKP